MPYNFQINRQPKMKMTLAFLSILIFYFLLHAFFMFHNKGIIFSIITHTRAPYYSVTLAVKIENKILMHTHVGVIISKLPVQGLGVEG